MTQNIESPNFPPTEASLNQFKVGIPFVDNVVDAVATNELVRIAGNLKTTNVRDNELESLFTYTLSVAPKIPTYKLSEYRDFTDEFAERMGKVIKPDDIALPYHTNSNIGFEAGKIYFVEDIGEKITEKLDKLIFSVDTTDIEDDLIKGGFEQSEEGSFVGRTEYSNRLYGEVTVQVFPHMEIAQDWHRDRSRFEDGISELRNSFYVQHPNLIPIEKLRMLEILEDRPSRIRRFANKYMR